MPWRDGTGPMGQGPMTGRGLGPCWNDDAVRDEMAAYLDVDGDGLDVDYAGADDDGINGWEVEDADGRAFMVSDDEDAFADFNESVTRTPGGLFYIREYTGSTPIKEAGPPVNFTFTATAKNIVDVLSGMDEPKWSFTGSKADARLLARKFIFIAGRWLDQADENELTGAIFYNTTPDLKFQGSIPQAYQIANDWVSFVRESAKFGMD